MVQMNKQDKRDWKLFLYALLGVGLGYYAGTTVGHGTEVLFIPIGLIYAVRLLNNQDE